MTSHDIASAKFYKSEQWVPLKLEGKDISNYRYIPGLNNEIRSKIESLVDKDEFRSQLESLLPCKQHTVEYAAGELLEFLATLDEDHSRAGSRIVDEFLTREIGAGVLLMKCHLDDIASERLSIRQVIYESMPTDVHFETLGGFSLATIHIKDCDPEIVEENHVHNGGRMVIALSENSLLELPDQSVALRKGDVVWMPPFTLHSFQVGDFLALHTSEAGFDHPEAFVPLNA